MSLVFSLLSTCIIFTSVWYYVQPMGHQWMHASFVEIYQLKQRNFGKKLPGLLCNVTVLEVRSMTQAKLGRNPHQSILSAQRGRKGLCLSLCQELTSPNTSSRTQVRFGTVLLVSSFSKLNYIFHSAQKPARDFIFQVTQRKKSHP